MWGHDIMLCGGVIDHLPGRDRPLLPISRAIALGCTWLAPSAHQRRVVAAIMPSELEMDLITELSCFPRKVISVHSVISNLGLIRLGTNDEVCGL